MSILNQYVNYFPMAKAKEGTSEYYGTKIYLREILIGMHTSEKHIQITKTLRNLPKTEQSVFKFSMMPCFTISGYFASNGKGSRDSKDLIYRTGLICLDLDPKDPNVNLKTLKQKIKSEPFVAYCGDSCRGEGIFAIVHISNPEKHEYYFDFFTCWLDDNECLSVFDIKTKNINRLRFIAPDPDYYINDNTIPLILPKIMEKITEVKQLSSTEFVSNYNFPDTQCKIAFAEKILNKQSCYFTDFNKHNFIFNLCCILNKMGVTQDEAEAYISTFIPLSKVKTNCIDYPFKKYTSEFNIWRNNNQ